MEQIGSIAHTGQPAVRSEVADQGGVEGGEGYGASQGDAQEGGACRQFMRRDAVVWYEYVTLQYGALVPGIQNVGAHKVARMPQTQQAGVFQRLSAGWYGCYGAA